jgi:hypothetical protein
VNTVLDKLLLRELQEYIRMNSIRLTVTVQESTPCFQEHSLPAYIPADELTEFIKNNRKPTFNQVLFGFIDQKKARDADIYKKAGIDRRHFSKIRTNPNYKIGKNSVIALAFALQLNKKETEKLLGAAGYSFSNSDTFDLIVQFFLEKNIYDIDALNWALDYFSLKTLSVD